MWVVAGGSHAFVAHRDPSSTRTTAEHTFVLAASATTPFVAIFIRDRLAAVADVGVALLAGAGTVFADRSNTRGIATGSLYTVASVVGGDVVASLATGSAVARTATLALLLAIGYALDVAGTRDRFRLDAAVSALAFAVPVWICFPSAAEAAGFGPETVGLAFGPMVTTALLSPLFAAIGYATMRTADTKRQAGISPVTSVVEQ